MLLELLFILGSELALLLVARGESETLPVLFFVELDRILFAEEAETRVRTGRKVPLTLRLISMCRRAISKDFLENDLPKPEFSRDKDFLEEFS